MLKQGLHVSLVRISVHVHPTEDIEKVKQALTNLLAMAIADLDENLDVSVLDGDYTNKIYVLTWTLKKPKDLDHFLACVKNGLPEDQKHALKQYFSSFFNPDSKTVYLRLHKQSAFENVFNISQYDDIFHVSIKFSSYTSNSSANAESNVLAFLLENSIVA